MGCKKINEMQFTLHKIIYVNIFFHEAYRMGQMRSTEKVAARAKGCNMTRLGIIRHGSTSWNKEGRAQGSTDIPLDEDGKLEAYKLAQRLRNEHWDIIYSSHLLRARQTAEIINENMENIPIYFDRRLREVGGGLIEGTTKEERIMKWGEHWPELDLGIEHAEIVTSRGLSFIDEITSKHSNMNILIVSHGSFIRQILKQLVPHMNEEGHLKNTSISKLLWTSNGWNCELYNCAAHLK